MESKSQILHYIHTLKKSFLFQLDSNNDGQLSFEEFKVLFDNAEKRRKLSQASETSSPSPGKLRLFELRKLN